MEIVAAKAELDAPKRRLRDEMRDVMTMKRYKHNSIEKYLGYCHEFARFHHRDPREMREPEINKFLTHLAVDKKVSWSTQHSAMCAIVCLYREVLKVHLGDFGQFSMASKPKRLPVVVSRERVLQILSEIQPEENRLVARKPGETIKSPLDA